jgi:predicted nucleic acid-binding Zn ribbon protein
MRKSAPRPLSGALEALTATIAPATTLARVQEAWERAVGPAVAAAAYPSFEREGMLTVVCAAAVWSHELELMAPTLIGRLNGALGEDSIKSLRCRTK